MKSLRRERGFTLIEILIYLGLMTLLGLALSVFFWNTTSVSERNGHMQSVATEARVATQRLGSIIRHADSLEYFSADRIELGDPDSSDTTAIYFSEGNILVDDGSSVSALLGSDVRGADMRFEETHTSDGRSQQIVFLLTLRPDWETAGEGENLNIRSGATLRNTWE
ncbi:MAG: prepilin-type N-terminal cleavage/methylation domain-containing protein [Candidatus Moranbacteria bacterium]|nr:prepilin-type N-terminal cleavage/methylation domain-containing protein [Candidatus Moranbacteria bacterium]